MFVVLTPRVFSSRFYVGFFWRGLIVGGFHLLPAPATVSTFCFFFLAWLGLPSTCLPSSVRRQILSSVSNIADPEVVVALRVRVPNVSCLAAVPKPKSMAGSPGLLIKRMVWI